MADNLRTVEVRLGHARDYAADAEYLPAPPNKAWLSGYRQATADLQALLVVLREICKAAEEVVDPKHHDPARDLLARARLRTAVAMVRDE